MQHSPPIPEITPPASPAKPRNLDVDTRQYWNRVFKYSLPASVGLSLVALCLYLFFAAPLPYLAAIAILAVLGFVLKVFFWRHAVKVMWIMGSVLPVLNNFFSDIFISIPLDTPYLFIHVLFILQSVFLYLSILYFLCFVSRKRIQKLIENES